MLCKKCGAEIEAGMMFCTECGARQEAWPEMKPHFCGKCGCTIPNAKDKICADCRAKEQAEAEPVAVPQPETEPEAAPEPTPAPEPQAAPEPEPTPPQEAKSSPAPQGEPEAEPTPEAEPEQEPKQEPDRKAESAFEPTAFAKEPGRKGKVAKICIAVLLTIILCEGLYYLFGMGGMKRIQSAMAKPQPTATAAVPSQAAPPTPAATSSAPELPPLPTAAESATTYSPIDRKTQTEEMRQKYQATGAEFIPVAGAQELMEFDGGVARVKIDGKWGFISDLGSDPVNLLYDEVMPFSEKMAAVRMDGQWGYIDKDNIAEPAICQWDSAGDYHRGYAVVSQGSKTYVIDMAGEIVMEPDCEKIRACGSGLFPILRDGKWGYIDIYERVVIPFEYDDAGSFASARAVVAREGKAFFIDTLGNAVTREYDDAWGFNENHTAKVQTNNQYGLITTDGDFLIRPEWDNVWNLQEGVATVQRGGKFGYVSQTDNIVVVQPVYGDVWSSSFGLIPVKTESGKWGYVDQVGNTAIEPQFDDAYIFGDGAARVSRDGSYGLIDITGKDICEFNYKQMGYIREGHCPAMTADGIWGYLKIGYR